MLTKSQKDVVIAQHQSLVSRPALGVALASATFAAIFIAALVRALG